MSYIIVIMDYSCKNERLPQAAHKRNQWYLTLVLHLLWGSANNVDLGGREANGGVDWDVFGWSIASKNLHVSLKLIKKKNNSEDICHISIAESRPFISIYTLIIKPPRTPPSLTSVRDLRKLALCLSGSWTKPSQKETMPWGKLCWDNQATTRCFCMSGRPVT